MKEASGELSMTAVAIIAIVAVGGIFTAFVWPSLRASLTNRTRCQTAFNCTACTVADGKETGTKTCSGYYDESGVAKTGDLTCECSK